MKIKTLPAYGKSLFVAICLTAYLSAFHSGAMAQGNINQPDTAMLKDGRMHIILCGTGSPLPDATRASSCTAVVAGGEMILVDTGPGSWRKVALNNLPAQALSAILITHFHSDHIGDLGEALMQSWAAGRAKPAEIYGPPGIEKVVAGFAQAFSMDTDYRVKHHSEEVMPRAAAGGVAHAVHLKNADSAATVFERNGLKVTAFKVEHDPASPAYGYRFEYAGRVIVITGDTAKSANVAKFSLNADLLIHDVLVKPLL